MVRSVASRGKFYQLPPDKENTDNRNRKSTLRQQALAIVVLIKIPFALFYGLLIRLQLSYLEAGLPTSHLQQC